MPLTVSLLTSFSACLSPGDLGFDPLGLFPLEVAAQKDMRTRELNNGRLGALLQRRCNWAKPEQA